VNKSIQAKTISDDEMLAAIRAEQESLDDTGWREKSVDLRWTSLWELQKRLEKYPPKVVLAKLRAMLRREVLYGCGCGCRGRLLHRRGGGRPLSSETAFARNTC
jgi:hypothetical protein